MGTRRCAANGGVWGSCTCVSYGAELYVAASSGNDGNSGTLGAPFKTLEKAQTAAQSLIGAGLPAGGLVVWLRAGTYSLSSTLNFTRKDSGTAVAPVVYRGYPSETARISGGATLTATDFQTVTSASSVWSRLDSTAQGKVVAANLGSLGISDFGMLAARGFSQNGVLSPLELFINGVREPLGRWPDQGESATGFADGFATLGTISSNTQFAFGQNRVGRWTSAPDPWVHGYFAYAWADSSEAVTGVVASSGLLTLAQAPYAGISATIQESGRPPQAYAFNLLEEITSPGEWYLDRSSGLLYLWPPANFDASYIQVSLSAGPLANVNGASNLTFQELTFEATRNNLLVVQGASSNVQVVGCELRDSGNEAVDVADGTAIVLDGDLIHDTGEGGVVLGGGDRPSLTKAGNTVKNSDIHDFSQLDWTYTPAVNLSGDGNIVENNSIHGAPHSGLLYTGSQNLVSENEIYDVCTFAGDSGAVYGGRNWSTQGNVLQFNFVHDIVTRFPGSPPVHAFYLDDCLSGITVTGNIIVNVGNFGLWHRGGRDDLMTHNVMLNCAQAALGSDATCYNAPSQVDSDPSWDFLSQLTAVKYQSPPWSTAFPAAAAIPDSYTTLKGDPAMWLAPRGSTFDDNLGFGNAAFIVNASPSSTTYYASNAGNLDSSDPKFVGESALVAPGLASKLPLALEPGSPVTALQGSNPTPLASIGIRP